MFVFEPQRRDYDCVLACLSMATELPYDTLWTGNFRQEVEDAKGTGKGDLHERALKYAGMVPKVNYISVYTQHAPQDLVKKMLWGRRALIQVPSLNYEGASHYVYWDGADLHDPSRKQQYRFLDTLSPEWVYLLKD